MQRIKDFYRIKTCDRCAYDFHRYDLFGKVLKCPNCQSCQDCACCPCGIVNCHYCPDRGRTAEESRKEFRARMKKYFEEKRDLFNR